MVKRGKSSSDFPNGLGADAIYSERLSTDMPVLMFPTDTKGSLRSTSSYEAWVQKAQPRSLEAKRQEIRATRNQIHPEGV